MANKKSLSFMVIMLLASVISSIATQVEIAGSSPSTIAYQSLPDAHTTSGITVTDPLNAYERYAASNDTFARFDYTTTGSFELKNFIIPDSYPTWAPDIIRVDFKMRYNTTLSSADDMYRIVYYVASSTAQELKAFTRDTTTLDTYAWPNQAEPNDDVWSWADIASIRFAVETQRVGAQDTGGAFWEYQAWVTVILPATAKFFVEPSSTFADPGESFTINMTANTVVDLYGFEFHMTWNPAILNITSVKLGPFVEPGAYVWVNYTDWWPKPALGQPDYRQPRGQMWFASNTVPLGTYRGEGKSGNGTLLEITFRVLPTAQGGSLLDIWEAKFGDSFGQALSPEVTDGTFGFVTQNPTASFSFTPSYPEVGETVSFNASESIDPDGTIVSYSWNFGDGNITTVSENTITHAYASAGTFTINLTVTDNTGLTGSTTKTATVVSQRIHDVAILSVTTSTPTAKPGDTVPIQVATKNNGHFVENFTVTLTYDTTQIGTTQTITNLAAGSQQPLSFSWNTTGVVAGTYTIKAEASIQGATDANLTNNSKTLQVTLQVPGETPILLYVGIGVAAVVAVVLVVYFVKLRKPKAA